MALTALQWLRKLLEDDPAPEHEVAIANGTEIEFYVSNPPITGAAVVKLNGVVKTVATDYSIAAVGGQSAKIVFTVAPTANDRVEIEYTRQTWTDDELGTYLGAADNDWVTGTAESVYQAACYAVDTLLMGAATALNFGSGEESYDMVSVWERLVRLRNEIWAPWLESRYDQPALAIADLVFDIDDPDVDWQNLGWLGGAAYSPFRY